MIQDEDVGLCFRLPGDGDRYLLPEALPANTPYLGNWPKDALRFRYRYDFLPRSLVPRFIVRAHDLLADPPTHWRTGAVFKVQDCPILVEADTDRKQIDILVDGPAGQRRSALGVIVHHLEAIHAKNPEADPTALVPLPDHPERDEEYQFLLTLEDEEGSDYRHRPTGAKRAYTVAELLDGVRHGPRPDPRPDNRDGAIGGRQYIADQIIVNEGAIQSEGGALNVGSRSSSEPSPPQSLPRAWAESLTSWRFFSLAAAATAVALGNLLYWLDSDEARLLIAGSAAIFVLAYIIVASFDPARFYRRLISWTIFTGLAANAAGFAFDAFFTSEPAAGRLRWDGSVSLGFNIAWVGVIAILAWLERSRRDDAGKQIWLFSKAAPIDLQPSWWGRR